MWRRNAASIAASVGGFPATHASTMSSRRYLSGRRFKRASESGNFGRYGDLLHGSPGRAALGEYDELPEDCMINPIFWHARSDPPMDANIQAFASRFGPNDPLRTCDMKHTLDAFLDYVGKICISSFPTTDQDPWVPIRVPHQ